MRHAIIALSLMLSAAGSAVGQSSVQRLALDAETTINGVKVACTGVGQTRLDPKWGAYPIRVEFSDAKNQYMTDAVVSLADQKGQALLEVSCEGPWVLMQPPQGAYQVHARLMDSAAKPRSARFTIPVRAQQRIVLQFPDA